MMSPKRRRRSTADSASSTPERREEPIATVNPALGRRVSQQLIPVLCVVYTVRLRA